MSDRAAIGTEGTALELAFAFARCGYTAGNAQFARVAWSLVAHSWSWIKFAYSYRRNKGAESASASLSLAGTFHLPAPQGEGTPRESKFTPRVDALGDRKLQSELFEQREMIRNTPVFDNPTPSNPANIEDIDGHLPTRGRVSHEWSLVRPRRVQP